MDPPPNRFTSGQITKKQKKSQRKAINKASTRLEWKEELDLDAPTIDLHLLDDEHGECSCIWRVSEAHLATLLQTGRLNPVNLSAAVPLPTDLSAATLPLKQPTLIDESLVGGQASFIARVVFEHVYQVQQDSVGSDPSTFTYSHRMHPPAVLLPLDLLAWPPRLRLGAVDGPLAEVAHPPAEFDYGPLIPNQPTHYNPDSSTTPFPLPVGPLKPSSGQSSPSPAGFPRRDSSRPFNQRDQSTPSASRVSGSPSPPVASSAPRSLLSPISTCSPSPRYSPYDPPPTSASAPLSSQSSSRSLFRSEIVLEQGEESGTSSRRERHFEGCSSARVFNSDHSNREQGDAGVMDFGSGMSHAQLYGGACETAYQEEAYYEEEPQPRNDPRYYRPTTPLPPTSFQYPTLPGPLVAGRRTPPNPRRRTPPSLHQRSSHIQADPPPPSNKIFTNSLLAPPLSRADINNREKQLKQERILEVAASRAKRRRLRDRTPPPQIAPEHVQDLQSYVTTNHLAMLSPAQLQHRGGIIALPSAGDQHPSYSYRSLLRIYKLVACNEFFGMQLCNRSEEGAVPLIRDGGIYWGRPLASGGIVAGVARRVRIARLAAGEEEGEVGQHS